MDKENVCDTYMYTHIHIRVCEIYITMEYYSSVQKQSCITALLDPEGIIQSEVSQTNAVWSHLCGEFKRRPHKPTGKRSDVWSPQAGTGRPGDRMKAVRKRKLPVTSKCQGCNARRDDWSPHSRTFGFTSVHRVNPHRSRHEEENTCFSLFFYIHLT